MKTIAKLKFGLVAFQILFHFDSVLAFPEKLTDSKARDFIRALTDLKNLQRNFGLMGVSPKTLDYDDFVKYWDSMQEIVTRHGFMEWREYILVGAVVTETFFTMDEQARVRCLDELRVSLDKILENPFLKDEDKDNAAEIMRLIIKQVKSGPPYFQPSEMDCSAIKPYLIQLNELYSFRG